MQPIERLLRRASLWIHIRRLLELLVVCLTIGASIVLVLRLGDRLFGSSLDWGRTWLIAAVASAAMALVWLVVTRRRRLAVAVLLDDAAGLNQSLSTALCVARKDDAWSRATVAHAARIAPGVPVSRSLPVKVRTWWAAPAVIAGLFFLAGLLPQFDLLGVIGKARAAEERELEVVEARADVEAMEDRLEELLSTVDDGALDEPDGGPEAAEPELNDPDEIRRAAVKKLTSLQDRIESLKQQTDSGMLDALKSKLGELNTSGLAELNEFSGALKRGQFDLAKRKLDELAKKLSSGELSEEQRQALQQQLERLAEQLEKMAEQREALEKALEEAGIDPALASDPEALRKALEQSDSLMPQQKRQLQQMADAMNQACKACKGLAQAAAGASSKMGQNAGGALGEMGDQLSQLEMLEQQLDQLDAMAQALAGELDSMCQGLGDASASMLIRSKRGGNGLGRGGDSEGVEQADFNTNKIKVKSKTGEGPIIGSTLVEGDQVRGESAQQFAAVVETGAAEAADAIESKQIPRELHDAVKTYFGRLEKESKGETPSEAAPDSDG